MTCAQGLLRLLWGGARSWSATGLCRREYLYEIPPSAASVLFGPDINAVN